MKNKSPAFATWFYYTYTYIPWTWKLHFDKSVDRCRPVKITDSKWILLKWLFCCGTQFSVYVVYRKQYAISENVSQSSGLCSCAYVFYAVPVQNGACAALSLQMDLICCPGLLLFLSRSRRKCALATLLNLRCLVFTIQLHIFCFLVFRLRNKSEPEQNNRL